MLAAKSLEVSDLQRMHDRSIEVWASKDFHAASDWDADFKALVARFRRAEVQAVAAESASAFVLPGLVATDLAYDAVIRAVKQAGDPGPRTKGDLADLAQRLKDAGFDVEFQPPPQPTAGDTDLQAFMAAGKLLEPIDPGLTGKPGLSTAEVVAIAAGVVVVAYVAGPIVAALITRKR